MRYGMSIFDIILTVPAMIVICSFFVISIMLIVFARNYMKKWQKYAVWSVILVCSPYVALVILLTVMFG